MGNNRNSRSCLHVCKSGSDFCISYIAGLFHNGKALNTIAPYGAACQSILFAADQIGQEEPLAVLGLFDISQRRSELKNYLSMTMPYRLLENMAKDLDKSCLTTHSWANIENSL